MNSSQAMHASKIHWTCTPGNPCSGTSENPLMPGRQRSRIALSAVRSNYLFNTVASCKWQFWRYAVACSDALPGNMGQYGK